MKNSPESMPQPNHPDLQTPYSVGQMEDDLGRNFYELDNQLNSADATHKVLGEIEDGLAHGDDAVLWELAGMPERRRTYDLDEQELHSNLVHAMFNALPPERQLEVMERVHQFVDSKMIDRGDWKK